MGRCTPRRVWWLRVNRGGRRQAFAFATEAEAREAARKLEAAAVLGQDYKPKETARTAPTFAALAEEALRLHVETRTLRSATQKNHQTFLDTHLLPAFGVLPVTAEAFSRLVLKRWIVEKRKTLKDSTLAAGLPTLRLILDHAVEAGVLATNPMRGGAPLWRAEDRAKSVDPFTPEEIQKILGAARTIDPDFATFLQIIAQTGLRPGEALGLRGCDVDRTRATVHVRGSFSRGVLGPTKNRQSVRVVSLLHPVMELKGWHPREAGVLTRRVLDGLAHLRVAPVSPEARLFNLRQAFFHQLWTRVLVKAKVRHRKPHALRHSFASILLSRNAPLVYVTRAGGWANASVLLRVYAHWIEEGADAASTPASNDLSPRRIASGQLDQ